MEIKPNNTLSTERFDVYLIPATSYSQRIMIIDKTNQKVYLHSLFLLGLKPIQSIEGEIKDFLKLIEQNGRIKEEVEEATLKVLKEIDKGLIKQTILPK